MREDWRELAVRLIEKRMGERMRFSRFVTIGQLEFLLYRARGSALCAVLRHPEGGYSDLEDVDPHEMLLGNPLRGAREVLFNLRLEELCQEIGDALAESLG